VSDVDGTCADAFQSLRDLLAVELSSGEELGAALCVDVDGETVVDLWGGWADEERTRPWRADTIVNVWSVTKTVTNLAALVLVDRGLLDVHAPVAAYWPQFAAAGKGAVEVRHLLSHTSGVAGWDAPFTTEDMLDLPRATARLAAQAPWWEPGTSSGYHAMSQGHLVGELVRRVSGRSLTQFVAEELAGPLQADFTLGVPASERHRVSPLVPPPRTPVDWDAMDPTDPLTRMLNGPRLSPTVANTLGWQQAEVGAANGHGNARSVARILSAVSRGGTVDGVRLLSDRTLDLVFEEQSRGVDLVLCVPLRFGIGFGLSEPRTVPDLPPGRTCFWCGWGGSMVVMDLDRRTTFSYTMNRMSPDLIGSRRGWGYLRAAYDVLRRA
jgi:CubicO group peptidase (beta-lactamase class C family)